MFDVLETCHKFRQGCVNTNNKKFFYNAFFTVKYKIAAPSADRRDGRQEWVS